MSIAPRVTALVILALWSAVAVAAIAPSASGQSGVIVTDGETGFVVSSFAYGLADSADKTRACPDGMSRSFVQNMPAYIPSAKRVGESNRDYSNRRAYEAALGPAGQNLCLKPSSAPDSTFRTVGRRNTPVYGIDLDGQVSRANGRAVKGGCAHDDFPGIEGGGGIDNQFFRVVGCIRGYQPGGLADIEQEMFTGAWTIVIKLKNVDDIRNDSDVVVGIHAAADPIQLGPRQLALAYATYTIDRDPRFRAETRGRIRKGVLTSDPVNVRFHFSANGKMFERSLRAARLQLTIGPDGAAQGYLSGYAEIDDFYKNEIGYDGDTFIAGSAAEASGYTCNGFYQALQKFADGHPDPSTGRCTSISTHYRIKATPAFILDPSPRP